MKDWLTLGGIALFVVTAFGMTHLNLTDADKASLATKPILYQRFIQFCRRGFMLVLIGMGLILLGMAISRSGGGNCDWDTHGEHCGPG